MFASQKPWLKFYPNDVVESFPIEEKSLTQMLAEAVERHGEKIALTFYTHKWTYRDLYKISEVLAGRLHAEGFAKGTRLAIMLPNSPHYVFTLFATFRLGGIAVQINPMYVEREIEHVLQDSGAEYMVVFAAFYDRVKKVQAHTKVKKLIVVDFGDQATTLADGDERFEDFLKAYTSKAPEIAIDPREDTAVFQYTGGTTGLSKGVMLTHANIMANVEQTYNFSFQRLDHVPENPKVMCVLPMFHIYGLSSVTFLGIRAGCNLIILPRFDVQEVVQTVQREKPFLFSGVPTMFIALLNHPDLTAYGFDQIKYYNSGGAAMPVEQLLALEQKVGSSLCEGYGLSEASPVTHCNPLFLERRAGSIGIPLPGTDARVVRETDSGIEEVPVGEVGELIVKGPQVMKGYWNNPEETRAVLRDGWLFTGDLARMDEDGYFYIVDRKKDMILAGGFNIYPREIEEVLYQHPAVQEAIVIGVPDPYRGETVKAFITLREGAVLTEEELIEFSRKYLAAYKVPRMVEFRDQLPKSAVGKLLKRVLRDEEWEKRAN
jgi:long-chain acyl-CoA synthetase